LKFGAEFTAKNHPYFKVWLNDFSLSSPTTLARLQDLRINSTSCFFFFEEGKEGDERERRIIKFLFNFFCLFL